jgi:putative FmdB family regulatory protein
VPTYQYVCTACGQDLEAVQSFSDAALTECPACSGRLRKKFSSVGVVFKGSGFYRTDSRSGNGSGSTAASSDKPAGDKPADKSPASSGTSEKKSDAGSSSGGSTGSSSSGTSSTSSSSAA